ncbi:hypothetical protein [Microcystis aeruginosa]|uniref:hypothetical protein n=1 Tax=Microcystis aeruginosa TaxID=1126 RepID=UPI0018831423|nr:hypothetical protein [Microcystis aeruginosa]
MMLATETRVQVSILGYLFSDLKEAVGGGQEIIFIYYPHTPHPTSQKKHTQPYKQIKTKLLL